ncbi:cysteine-rich CWC family protein [Marinoscillum sp. MHG1-6]|uniref:cysteine-rich CWC family protein n=1 Tax=Marinoscillum sp. MHG1-6 TaxID=2959627 RepID=UPI0021577B43|nr:cysteine-rich CWC family protein [Marinoscillum sp. MHG1-6]
MEKHEIKKCVKCGSSFECKVGSIHLCQCMTVTMTNEERQFLKEGYEDCLCKNCLIEGKRQYQQKQFKEKLKGLGDQFG